MKVRYNKKLKNAAQDYLIKLFENPKEASESSATVVGCAMVILQGVGWFQDEKENVMNTIQELLSQGGPSENDD